MPETPDPAPTANQTAALLATTEQLLRKVSELDKHLRIAEGTSKTAKRAAAEAARVAERSRILTIVAVVSAVLSLLVVGGIGYLYVQQKHDATVACQNANDQRAQQLLLWRTVLAASSNNPQQTPAQKAQSKAFGDWVTALFVEHDCNNLAKVYHAPPPPKLGP